MGAIEIRCYGELNDFLPPPRRQRAFTVPWGAPGSVKDALESAGIPHPELDLILVDGQPVGFDRLLTSGRRVAAYPRFRRLDVSGISPVHLPPPADPRFLLDDHLRGLARLLRLLGLDAEHHSPTADADLAAAAADGDLILLTRDRDLLKRAVVRRGYRVRSTAPEEQAVEVVRRFDLAGRLAPFSRCLPCGARLTAATPAEAAGAPTAVAARETEYRHCPGCGRLYWRGSHYRRLAALAARLAERAGA